MSAPPFLPANGQTGKQFVKLDTPYFTYLEADATTFNVTASGDQSSLTGRDGDEVTDTFHNGKLTATGTFRVIAGGENLTIEGYIKSKDDPGDAGNNPWIDYWWKINALRVTDMIGGKPAAYELELVWRKKFQDLAVADPNDVGGDLDVVAAP